MHPTARDTGAARYLTAIRIPRSCFAPTQEITQFRFEDAVFLYATDK